MKLPTGKAFKCLLLSIVCLVCYGNTIPNDYAYDDAVVITENKLTQRGLSGIAEIFKSDSFSGSYEGVSTPARYRPFSLATFAVERALFGQNPHVSHAVNVLLFALTVVVLYLFLARLFGQSLATDGFLSLPFVAALLFAVHPIHTEIVANIKGRDEILVLAGCLSATLCALRYLDHRKSRFLVLGFCLFLVALFSKENAITFLAVVPLSVFYCRRGARGEYLYTLVPFVVAGGIFLAARSLILSGSAQTLPEDILTEPFVHASLSQRWATIFYTFARYLGLLFLPYPLTIDYYPFHIRLADWGSVAVWLSLAAHVALAVYASWNLRKRSVIAYGILFYIVTFSVVSNVPFSTGTFMSERAMFLPSLGFVVIVARLLTHRTFPPVAYKIAIVVATSLACALVTVGRNRAWRDDFTLFTTDAKTSANSIKANMVASLTFLQEAQQRPGSAAEAEYRSQALTHARQAVALYRQNLDETHLKGSSYSSAVMLLGNCYSANGMLEDALNSYQQAAEAAPNPDVLCEMVERTMAKSTDVDFKIRSYAALVKLLPDCFSVNYHLGLLYGKEKNDLAMAIFYLKKAVDIAPQHGNALRGLAYAYKLSNEYDQAAFYFARVADQEPGNLALLGSLRNLYRLAGNRAKMQETTKRMMAASLEAAAQ